MLDPCLLRSGVDKLSLLRWISGFIHLSDVPVLSSMIVAFFRSRMISGFNYASSAGVPLSSGLISSSFTHVYGFGYV